MARRTTVWRLAVHLAGVGCVGCVLTAVQFDAILVALFSGRVPVLVAVSLVSADWTTVCCSTRGTAVWSTPCPFPTAPPT